VSLQFSTVTVNKDEQCGAGARGHLRLVGEATANVQTRKVGTGARRWRRQTTSDTWRPRPLPRVTQSDGQRSQPV